MRRSLSHETVQWMSMNKKQYKLRAAHTGALVSCDCHFGVCIAKLNNE